MLLTPVSEKLGPDYGKRRFSGNAAVSDETMNTAEYYPYRNAAARDLCFRYLDGLAARLWPIVSEERMVPTTFGATFVRVRDWRLLRSRHCRRGGVRIFVWLGIRSAIHGI